MNTQCYVAFCRIAACMATFLILGLGKVVAQDPFRTGPAIPKQAESPSTEVQAGQEEAAPKAPSATTHYYQRLATDFQSPDSTVTTQYDFDGCIHRSAGTINLSFPLIVSPGSIIKQLRAIYVDNDASSNITVSLIAWPPGTSAATLIASVTSSGSSPLARTTDSSVVTHTVDYNINSYLLVFAPGVNSSLSQLCGVKVTYEQGIFGVAMPIVTR
jgi:hypothetical protein